MSVRPAWITTSNRFTYLFSQAVESSGWSVREFGWSRSGLFAPQVVLIHWPYELFTPQGPFDNAKVVGKILLLQAARKMGRVKLVWVVHETYEPTGKIAAWARGAFIDALDGVIFLSHASRREVEGQLPQLKGLPALVTRHGHYRSDMETPPQPRRKPGEKLNLLFFGQIQPYKNIDGLIRAAGSLSPAEVSVKLVGWAKDQGFARWLTELASKAPAVALDFRDTFVPQADIEAALDECDGVVLPYRFIVNSGSAVFALSRNRPVLAPRLGTLPELREEIGEEWVDIFDDDITSGSLAAFADRLRRPRETLADLSHYEWRPIGESIGRFFDQLTATPGQPSPKPVQAGSERNTWL